MRSRPLPRSRRALLASRVSGTSYFFLRPASRARREPAVVFGGRETCNSDYSVRRSSYAYHVIEYVAEGLGCVRLNGREAMLAPGVVFAYAPDTRCEIRTDPARPMLKYFVCLTGAGVPARLARARLAPGGVRVLSVPSAIRSLWEELIREGRHQGRLAPRICGALVEVLLLKLEELGTRRARRADAAEERFLRCKAIIDSRFEQTRSLGEIALAVGIRPSSVCRLFRRFQGTSPYRYLLRRKMILAAEDLVENGGLVQAAAQRVGFTDAYHFSRCFKTVHGIAPSRLRAYRASR